MNRLNMNDADCSFDDLLCQSLSLFPLNSLPLRERQIIKYRYGYDDGAFHSFSEVASKFSISRQRAQIIEKVAINKMKEFIKKVE